jgi:hypothetical protein
MIYGRRGNGRNARAYGWRGLALMLASFTAGWVALALTVRGPR